MNKKTQFIEVVPYDPNWPKQFAEEALRIKQIVAEIFSAIHHIGSTSVPGLAAKPTIDILLEVKNIALVDQYIPQMEKLAYEAWGEYGIIGRRYFVKGETKRTHHVHTFENGNPDIARHLYFRDYLISHPQEAVEYSALKIKLAQQYAHDRHNYLLGKQDFVKALEHKACVYFGKLNIP